MEFEQISDRSNSYNGKESALMAELKRDKPQEPQAGLAAKSDSLPIFAIDREKEIGILKAEEEKQFQSLLATKSSGIGFGTTIGSMVVGFALGYKFLGPEAGAAGLVIGAIGGFAVGQGVSNYYEHSANLTHIESKESALLHKTIAR